MYKKDYPTDRRDIEKVRSGFPTINYCGLESKMERIPVSTSSISSNHGIPRFLEIILRI